MDSEQLKKMCNKYKLEYAKTNDKEGEWICNGILDCIEKSDKYDKVKETIKRDIEDGNFVRHGIKQGGKDGSTYYKLTAKEYAQECLEEMED